MAEYTLVGECNACGDCCRAIELWLAKSGDAAYDEDYGRWLALHDGVMVTEEADGYAVALRLRCGRLVDDPGSGRSRCTIYEQRPQLCRDWPYGPRDLIGLPRCSLHFELAPACAGAGQESDDSRG